MNKIWKIVRQFASSPSLSLLGAASLVLMAIAVRWLPDHWRSNWLSLIAFGFALFTWLLIAVKQWPCMEITGMPCNENVFCPVSSNGAFRLMAWFCFFNKSAAPNAVVGCRFLIRIGNESNVWYVINPEITDDDKRQLSLGHDHNPNSPLIIPEIYAPYTVRTQFLAFSFRVPRDQTSGESPRALLKAEFDMADGPRESCQIELRWSGKLPTEFVRYRYNI